jgi:hypothetical protein
MFAEERVECFDGREQGINVVHIRAVRAPTTQIVLYLRPKSLLEFAWIVDYQHRIGLKVIEESL